MDPTRGKPMQRARLNRAERRKTFVRQRGYSRHRLAQLRDHPVPPRLMPIVVVGYANFKAQRGARMGPTKVRVSEITLVKGGGDNLGDSG